MPSQGRVWQQRRARAEAARKRKAKWSRRILNYLQIEGPMTLQQLRAHKRIANLDASDKWLGALLDQMAIQGLLTYDPLARTYTRADLGDKA